ncbi:helix-turn-helix domain-containing protein [Halopseudomonas pertucinogena]|uniref:AraC family transcriptional regulator n=1 Tax=Halopseudomonas pertucinogena TaxID=86175 RepID=A0ABQ2CN74_9GAMM|nr:AraC family transcriptional regulator [Halopseudomonas pertucinogena]GGI97219.1 AraC family transcriptional regulator [Halopseudomonas pertucinogena]
MPGSIRDRARHRVREHSHWVAAIDRALGHYGVDLTHSSLALGLTSSRLPSTPFIEQANANLLWIEASRLSGDEFFGLRLNRAHFPSAINLLALAASTTVTVGTAIEHLIRFFPIVSTQVRLDLTREVSEATLTIHPVGEPHGQHIDAVLGYLGRILNQLDDAGKGLFRRATLRRPHADMETCHRLLECDEVISGPFYTLAIPLALLDRPLATADAFICTRLTDTLQDMLANQPSHDLVEQVKRRVQLLLGSGDISVERIATPLNISPRHLRRKLSQEGTSYEQLVDEVRRETAIRMIGEGELSLTSIAYELGFLDPSSFTRAFRRWTNMSPTSFRQQVNSAPEADAGGG